MSTLIFILIQIAVMLQTALLVNGIETVPVVIAGDGGNVCPNVQDSLQTIRERVKSFVDVLVKREDCGGGLWVRVAHLNMSDPSQQCPSAWREYNTSGIRACGRPAISEGSCPSTTYSTNRQYNKVCGRVIGYQVASPDAFQTDHQSDRSINGFYVDGVSITHGSPRNHIWTYVAAVYELEDLPTAEYVCPCSSSQNARQPPLFVGDDYYCESGNPTDTWTGGQIFSNDKLWDGEQCENEGTCCTTKSPPWFSVELTNTTTDDIEIRICGSEDTDNEDTPIQLLEVYVQ